MKRFWFYFVVGILLASTNAWLLAVVDKQPSNSWERYYIIPGGMGLLILWPASVSYVFLSRFGKGFKSGEVGLDGRYHGWEGDPVPGRAGLAAGFAVGCVLVVFYLIVR